MKNFTKALAFVAHALPNPRSVPTRPWLEGVCFDLEGGRLNLVATDGHRMAICELSTEYRAPGVSGHVLQFTLPIGAVKMILALKAKRVLLHDMNEKVLTLNLDGHLHEFQAQDGKFPDWRRVDPTQAHRPGPEATAEIGLQAAALAAACTALGKLGSDSVPAVKMAFGGAMGAVLLTVATGHDSGLIDPRVVVMPTRL